MLDELELNILIKQGEEKLLEIKKYLFFKDKKERMNEEREETQKQFATIGYIKQMINEIKENFLKKEAEKKIYSDIYNRIEKKKEEIEEKKKERIDVITKEKVFDRIKWIYLVLTFLLEIIEIREWKSLKREIEL